MLRTLKSVARRSVVVEADHAHPCGGSDRRPPFSGVHPRHDSWLPAVQGRPSLVVADCESVLGSALEKSGYMVEVATNRQVDLERIRANPPDLVICHASSMRMNELGACMDMLELLSECRDRRMAVQFVVVMRDREDGDLRADGDDPRNIETRQGLVPNNGPGDNDQGSQPSAVELTNREKEVLTWAARGKTSADIAEILGLKERTVNFHCDNAMKRLDVINRTQAVAKAVAKGLIGI